MLICLVTLEMIRPRCPSEYRLDFVARTHRWQLQREHGDALCPEPEAGEVRMWRGTPESRDWYGLEAAKRCDGWTVLSHRREFVDDGVREDQVELAA